MAGGGFTRLRRRIAEIEGRPAGFEGGPPAGSGDASSPLPAGLAAVPGAPARHLLSPRRGETVLAFGIPRLDALLRGGLRRDALHEIRGETTRDAGAAAGFAAALVARLMAADDRPVLWVTEAAAAHEAGSLYGPGLDLFGVAARRLVVVAVRRPEEALWVVEEGLRCTGLAAVAAELRGHPRALDLTASRRLALRAREHGVMGLLLRQAATAAPGAALTRWRVSPRPAAEAGGFAAGIGRPAWSLVLERNRAGATGVFDLEWDHARRAFAAAEPALSLPLAAAPADRPHPAQPAGAVVAFRRAG